MQKKDEFFDDGSRNAGKRAKIKDQQDSKDQILTVYIWDMDETLILLKSLLNGAYAEAFNGSKDVQKGIEIGKNWEKHILHACDQFFFYEQVGWLFKICAFIFFVLTDLIFDVKDTVICSVVL